MDSSSSWRFLVYSLTTFTLFLTLAKSDPLRHFCSNSTGNFTKNSTYEANLNRLLSSFSSKNTSNDYGFYNLSSGQGSNKANGIALCRGDLNSDGCLECIKNAASELRNRCPNQKEAIIWYDYCMFRYTNRPTFGIEETEPFFYMKNPYNVTDGDIFTQALRALLDSLITKASTGNSVRKFATGTALRTITALVQCTPDLNATQCGSCLNKFLSVTPQCCDRRQGGRVAGPSCNLRFEIYDFYNLTTADTPLKSPLTLPWRPPASLLSPPFSNATTIGKKSNSTRDVIIITFLAVAIAVLLIYSCIFFVLRTRKSKVKLQMTKSTSDFCDANKLGYKNQIEPEMKFQSVSKIDVSVAELHPR